MSDKKASLHHDKHSVYYATDEIGYELHTVVKVHSDEDDFPFNKY